MNKWEEQEELYKLMEIKNRQVADELIAKTIEYEEYVKKMNDITEWYKKELRDIFKKE